MANVNLASSPCWNVPRNWIYPILPSSNYTASTNHNAFTPSIASNQPTNQLTHQDRLICRPLGIRSTSHFHHHLQHPRIRTRQTKKLRPFSLLSSYSSTGGPSIPCASVRQSQRLRHWGSTCSVLGLLLRAGRVGVGAGGAGDGDGAADAPSDLFAGSTTPVKNQAKEVVSFGEAARVRIWQGEVARMARCGWILPSSLPLLRPLQLQLQKQENHDAVSLSHLFCYATTVVLFLLAYFQSGNDATGEASDFGGGGRLWGYWVIISRS